MPVWLLEPKPGSVGPWEGYLDVERVVVVAPSDREARKIAARALPMRGHQPLAEPQGTPWQDLSACACLDITNESGTCVLAVQGDEWHLVNAQLCRENSKAP